MTLYNMNSCTAECAQTSTGLSDHDRDSLPRPRRRAAPALARSLALAGGRASESVCFDCTHDTFVRPDTDHDDTTQIFNGSLRIVLTPRSSRTRHAQHSLAAEYSRKPDGLSRAFTRCEAIAPSTTLLALSSPMAWQTSNRLQCPAFGRTWCDFHLSCVTCMATSFTGLRRPSNPAQCTYGVAHT